MFNLSKKKLFMKTIIALISMLFFTSIYAQTSSDNIKANLMKMDGKYYIYLTKNGGNLPNTKHHISANWIDGKGKKAVLKIGLSGKKAFVVNTNIDGFKKIRISIHKENLSDRKDNYTVIEFVNKSNEETAYTCPMHHDEISKLNGKCPECGMGLVATKTKVFSNNFSKGHY